MPVTSPPSLSLAAAADFLRRTSFVDGPSGTVGVELEWLVVPLVPRPGPPAATGELVGRLPALPGGSRVTVEPGGQVELSSARAASAGAAVAAVAADVAVVRSHLAGLGLGLLGMGLHPDGPRPLVRPSSRHRAMDTYFSAAGPAGRTMMTATASVQVNLDAGPAEQHRDRWTAAHRLAPVLAAAFADSPVAFGRPSGRRSARLGTWAAIDPTRSSPAWRPMQGCDSWVRYALDARVMFIRTDDGRFHPVPERLTFAGWIAGGHALGHPTTADLEYHVTTLFPPVRPRGWLELRFLDALPPPWWPVAVAVTAILLDDEAARAEASAAAAGVADCWSEAARWGPAHPALARVGRRCFDIALAALAGGHGDPAMVGPAASYVDRFVARGRCPADDRLDRWHRTGSCVLPEDELDHLACAPAGAC